MSFEISFRLLRKAILLLFCAVQLLAMVSITLAQAPDFSWVCQLGGDQYEPYGSPYSSTLVQSVASDHDGNIIIVAQLYAANPTFAGPLATNSCAMGGCLAKVDQSANLIWMKSLGTNVGYLGVTTDRQGNIYATGYTNMLFPDSSDVLLSKFDRNGNLQWSVSSQGQYVDDGAQVSVDDGTNIYITGMFYSTNMIIGSISLTNDNPAGGSDNQFMAKFDSSGKPVWAKALYGANPYLSIKPGFDSTGNVIIASIFSQGLNFDGTTLTNTGACDIFAAKFDTSGNVLWIKDIGIGDFSSGVGRSINSSGCLFLGGVPVGFPITLGTFVLTNAQYGFIAKCDPNGNMLWAKGSSLQYGGGVFGDAMGNLYLSGGFYATYGTNVNVSGVPLSCPSGNHIAYVAKYDASGSVLWVTRLFEGNNSAELTGFLAGDLFGNIYLAGQFSSASQFGSLPATALNPNASFLARLDGPSVNLQTLGGRVVLSWPTNATGLTLEATSSLATPDWSHVTNTPCIVGNSFVVTNSISSPAQFFRLRNF